MTDFDLVGEDNMEFVITDLVILNKKEKAPPKYTSIEPPINEGGRLSFAKRYIAYTREIPNRLGRVAVTDVKIIPSSDRVPLGYRPLAETMDDNVKPFASKLVVVKMDPLEEIKEAITDVVVLSGSKKENVPSGYKRLPEINGFSVCFKTSKIEKKNDSTDGSKDENTAQLPADQKLLKQSLPENIDKQVSNTPKKAIDGLTFELSDSQDIKQYLTKYLLPDMEILSLDDVDKKYKFDWTFEEQQLAN